MVDCARGPGRGDASERVRQGGIVIVVLLATVVALIVAVIVGERRCRETHECDRVY